MLCLIELASGMIIVFTAAMLFVNAVEYVGWKFHLGSSFIGAILAPLFTSFPEMIVFLVAVFVYWGISGEAIGIGTLFGQPFMASSLSYGLVGVAALIGYYLKRRDDLVLEVDRTLITPYLFITLLFPLTLVPAIIGYSYAFGVFFLSTYVVYA